MNTNAPLQPRIIFLLTDGQVSNTKSVIQLATKAKSHTRIFSIGIGESPSKALVEGVASASNGKSGIYIILYKIFNLFRNDYRSFWNQ